MRCFIMADLKPPSGRPRIMRRTAINTRIGLKRDLPIDCHIVKSAVILKERIKSVAN